MKEMIPLRFFSVAHVSITSVDVSFPVQEAFEVWFETCVCKLGVEPLCKMMLFVLKFASVFVLHRIGCLHRERHFCSGGLSF